MKKILCDKCNKEIQYWKGWLLFEVKINSNDVMDKYDLCKSCYKLVEKYLEEKPKGAKRK